MNGIYNNKENGRAKLGLTSQLNGQSKTRISKRYLSLSEVVEEEKEKLGASYSPERHLLHVCVVGDLEMAKYLVEHEGVNKYYINTSSFSSHIHPGDSFLNVAIKFNNVKLAEYLKSQGFQLWETSESLKTYFSMIKSC